MVAVPVLVLALAPTAHAEDWSAPPGDSRTSQASEVNEASEDPGDGGLPVRQPDPQDPSIPTPAAEAPDLAQATDAAQQVLTATPPQPAPPGQAASNDPPGGLQVASVAAATEPASDPQGPRGPLPVTPNLLFPLDLNPTQGRQRIPTAPGEDEGEGDPPWPPVPGDQTPSGTWKLHIVELDGDPPEAPARTANAAAHPAAPASPAASQLAERPQPTAPPGPDPDPASLGIASLVMASGDPTRAQATDLQVPADPRSQPSTTAVTLDSRPLQLGLGHPDLLRAGIGGPGFAFGAQAVSPGQSDKQPDQQTMLREVPGAAAAVIAGWGPVRTSPTLTAAGALDVFLIRLMELMDRARAEGQAERPIVHRLYSADLDRLPFDDDSALLRWAIGGRPPRVPFRDRSAYRVRATGLSPSRTPPQIQLSGEAEFYVYSPGSAEDIRYRLHINADPQHAPDILAALVNEVAAGGGMPEYKLATPASVAARRDNVQVTAANRAAMERQVLRLRRLLVQHPDWFGNLPVWIGDPLFKAVALTVEPPRPGYVFAAERGTLIQFALADEPRNLGELRAGVHERLLAQGVSPDAPHAQLNLPTLSLERRMWLQAGGRSLRGYNLLGGLRFSAALTNTYVGGGLGGVLGLYSVVGHPQGYLHDLCDLTVATTAAAAGGYLGGQVEFALNAHLAPELWTTANAPLSVGLRGMVLPRLLAGGLAGGLTAPLITIAIMVLDTLVFGADLHGTDLAAIGTRNTAGGTIGGALSAGAAALTTYLLGAAAFGTTGALTISLVGLAVGLGVYALVDWLWGDTIEQWMRTTVGGPPPAGRAAAI